MLADTLQEPSLQVDIQEQDRQEGIGVNLFVVNTVGLLFSELLLGRRSLMMTAFTYTTNTRCGSRTVVGI